MTGMIASVSFPGTWFSERLLTNITYQWFRLMVHSMMLIPHKNTMESLIAGCHHTSEPVFGFGAMYTMGSDIEGSMPSKSLFGF